MSSFLWLLSELCRVTSIQRMQQMVTLHPLCCLLHDTVSHCKLLPAADSDIRMPHVSCLQNSSSDSNDNRLERVACYNQVGNSVEGVSPAGSRSSRLVKLHFRAEDSFHAGGTRSASSSSSSSSRLKGPYQTGQLVGSSRRYPVSQVNVVNPVRLVIPAGLLTLFAVCTRASATNSGRLITSRSEWCTSSRKQLSVTAYLLCR